MTNKLVNDRYPRVSPRAVWILITSVLLITSVACMKQDDKGARDHTVLYRSIDADPSTLEPQLTIDLGATEIARDVFEGLMSTDPEGNLVLGAAQSVTISDDGLEYLFRLREAGKWSNGDAVTAEDFARGIAFATDPKNLAPQAALLNSILGVEDEQTDSLRADIQQGVQAISDLELLIKLKSPTPYFLGLLEYPIAYPRHENASVEPFLSNGPYRITERRHNHYIDAEKNPYYWNADAVHISRVRYLPVDDEITLLNLFRAGNIDVTSTVPNSMMPWILQNLPSQYRAFPQLGVYYFAINLDDPRFRDIGVRRALSISIDRQTLVNHVTKGDQEPALSFVPKFMPGYDPAEAPDLGESLPERREIAQQLLANAGYSYSNPLNFELLTNTGDNHSEIATFITQQWSEVLPVRATVRSVEFKLLLDLQHDRESWGIVRSSWIADFPDAYNFLSIFESSNANNLSHYANPEYDALLAASMREADPNVRSAILKQAEEILLADYPAIFLYTYAKRRLVSNTVKGFVGNAMAISRTAHLRWAENPGDPQID